MAAKTTGIDMGSEEIRHCHPRYKFCVFTKNFLSPIQRTKTPFSLPQWTSFSSVQLSHRWRLIRLLDTEHNITWHVTLLRCSA